MPNYYINKTAVITGAANGLGKAIALQLAKRQCNLALIDIDTSGLELLAKELAAYGIICSLHTADIADEEQVKTAAADIIARHNAVDILINNAAISSSQPFHQVELGFYRRLMDVNFWGTVYCTRHFLPMLTKQPDSRLVNVVSYFAWVGFPGKTTYGSSKSAVMGFTNALLAELNGTSVKVSLVIPPPLSTNLISTGLHISEEKKQAELKFMQAQGMPVDRAARIAVNGIATGRYRIFVGLKMALVDLGVRISPWLAQKFLAGKRFDFT